jgi:murein tripeptide amidase MpaA
MSVNISISDSYDGGNIEFVSQSSATTNDGLPVMRAIVTVRIKPDVYTELEAMNHMQYFSFRATISGLEDGKYIQVNYEIENASKVSYPVAWDGTTIFYTANVEDSESWLRNHTTRYLNGKLSWMHRHVSNGSVYFSYFPPFSYGRHLQLVAKCSPYSCVTSLGQTLEGREIDCITAGRGDRVCWIIHRQHPGETMAEFYAEGVLTRLLGLDSNGQVDDKVIGILEMYTLHIVPCMCLDGAVAGHLRTNGCGANLNREWASKGDYIAPSKERSPEVLAVLTKMEETGVDIFLDIHGDEELPFNFICGAEHVPTWGKRLESLHGAFAASYHRANRDMQQFIGYPPAESPEQAEKYLNVATNQIATRFDCLSVTLEMPFKDCETNPDPDRGWSPAKARNLGASVLEPLFYVHPYLRAEGDFWLAFPPEDAYIEPTDEYQEFKPLSKRMYSDVRAILK